MVNTRGIKNATPGARRSSSAATKPKKAAKAAKPPPPPPPPTLPDLPPFLEDLPPSVTASKSNDPSDDEDDSPVASLGMKKTKALPKPTMPVAVKLPIVEEGALVVKPPPPPPIVAAGLPDSSYHTPTAQAKRPSGAFYPPARPIRSYPVQNPNQPVTCALIAGGVSSPTALLQDSYQAFCETDGAKEQMNLVRVSNSHAAECARLFTSFIEFIIHFATFLVPFLREIVASIYPQDPAIPRVIHFLGGDVTREKVNVANALLTRWSVGLKNLKDPKKHLQPNTHARKIRTLLGHLRSAYNWNFSLDNDFNFPGGLAAVMKNLFDQRMQFARDHGGNDYGTLPNRQIVSNVRSVADLRWDVFNEAIPSEFQAKIMAICACYFGFRGRKEHAYLCINQIRQGYFPIGHMFEGMMFYAIVMQFDKGNQLSMNRTTCREDTTEVLRIPVMDVNDQNDPGGSIHRFIDALSPGQLRMYCYALKKEEKRRLQATYPNSMFCPNRPLGENAVATKLKVAAKKLGLGDVTGHGLRRLCCTTLSNASGVSSKEVIGTMRHTSISTSNEYSERNIDSEAAKLIAQGFKPPAANLKKD